jgi:DNA-binding NarL/FixJ family response regulator
MKARVISSSAGGKRQGAAERTGTERRRIRTVIVDDAPFVVQSLESFFRRQEGFDLVGTATSGQEAVQRVAELRPDLVLMDIRMAGMDGLEATRRIKGHEESPVVIMLSLEDSAGVRAAAKAAGADGFATKVPKMLEALRAAIGRAFPEVEVRQWNECGNVRD